MFDLNDDAIPNNSGDMLNAEHQVMSTIGFAASNGTASTSNSTRSDPLATPTEFIRTPSSHSYLFISIGICSFLIILALFLWIRNKRRLYGVPGQRRRRAQFLVPIYNWRLSASGLPADADRSRRGQDESRIPYNRLPSNAMTGSSQDLRGSFGGGVDWEAAMLDEDAVYRPSTYVQSNSNVQPRLELSNQRI